MSPPWLNSLDIERVADAHTDIDFSVPVEKLKRLEHFSGLAGSVSGHVRFERVAGIPAADLRVQGTVQLTCQVCLEPLVVPVDREVRVGLVESEAEINRVPEELEPVLAPGGHISTGALVEEELLLTLPIVPQHGGCAPEAAGAQAAEPEPPNRPLAGLGELLKRK